MVAPDSEDGDSDCGVELPEAEASAAAWFANVFPSLRSRAASEFGLTDEALGLVDLVQRPGDTVFIPAGWWHVAVTDKPAGCEPASTDGGPKEHGITVGVTYNYMPATGFEDALARLAARPGGAKSAYRWCRRAADAGLPEAVRCLALPAVLAGKAMADAEEREEGEGTT